MTEGPYSRTHEAYARALAESSYPSQAGILLAVLRGLRGEHESKTPTIWQRYADEILALEDMDAQRRDKERAAEGDERHA